jgi:hypothetical protein
MSTYCNTGAGSQTKAPKYFRSGPCGSLLRKAPLKGALSHCTFSESQDSGFNHCFVAVFRRYTHITHIKTKAHPGRLTWLPPVRTYTGPRPGSR